MHKYLPIAALMIAILVIGASGWRSAQGVSTATPATIGVTAEGLVHAAPDTARIWIGVEVFGPTLAPADREADQRVTAVIAALHSAGIADPHISTAGITIAPQYVTQNGLPQQLSGYISRSMLEVESSDLHGLPALIDGAIGAGANRVDLIRLESSALDQLRSQARDQAWQAARVQADQLATRAGTRLDQVISVDESMIEDTTPITPDPATGYLLINPQSSVHSGEIQVRSRLHVVWSTQ